MARYLLGGRLCLDFCNTVHSRYESHAADYLQTYQGLLDWGIDTGTISESSAQLLQQAAQMHPDSAEAARREAVTLREAIYQIALSIIQQSSPASEAVSFLNDLYSRARANRQLVPSDHALTWKWKDSLAFDTILWQVADSAADLFTAGELERLRQCPGCGWLFYDHSDNGRRVWCDMRFCGNRAKARRHQERHKQP